MADGPASFLGALAPDDVAALQAAGMTRRYRSGDTILHQHDDPGRVLVLERGRVRVSHFDADGRETILGFRQEGDLVGELSAIDGNTRSATVQATSPVEVLALTGEAFRGLLATRPAIAFGLMRYLVLRLRAADALRVDQATRNVVGRVAGRLSEMCEAQAGSPGETAVLALGQEELAAWVGASREAASRALHLLRVLGVVETGRRRIVVLDSVALRRYAG